MGVKVLASVLVLLGDALPFLPNHSRLGYLSNSAWRQPRRISGGSDQLGTGSQSAPLSG